MTRQCAWVTFTDVHRRCPYGCRTRHITDAPTRAWSLEGAYRTLYSAGQDECAWCQGSQPGLTRMTFRLLFDTYGTKPAARDWVYALATLAAMSA